MVAGYNYVPTPTRAHRMKPYSTSEERKQQYLGMSLGSHSRLGPGGRLYAKQLFDQALMEAYAPNTFVKT